MGKIHKYFAPCTVKRAANDSGARRATSIRLIVLHSAESTSASGVAGYFARPATQASTQLAVDAKSCYRMIPDLVVPWGAPGANSDGLHIELCGYARWTKDEWLERQALLERAAAKCAAWAWTYRIPRRYLTREQLLDGRSRGFTTHADVNAAFKRGDHWDPGLGFPRVEYMAHVRRFYKLLADDRRRT